MAMQRNLSDRPDLIFWESQSIKRLKQELMESADAGCCVQLTNEIIKQMMVDLSGTHDSERVFFREQRDRHFKDLLGCPPEVSNAPESHKQGEFDF
jgi:hypothetical protein